jgi:hypothetical protein
MGHITIVHDFGLFWEFEEEWSLGMSMFRYKDSIKIDRKSTQYKYLAQIGTSGRLLWTQ